MVQFASRQQFEPVFDGCLADWTFAVEVLTSSVVLLGKIVLLVILIAFVCIVWLFRFLFRILWEFGCEEGCTMLVVF